MSEEHPKRWQWLAIGLIVTWSLTLIGGVWAVATDRQSLTLRSELNAVQLDDHEQRLRVIEQQLHQIRTDVRWIRHHLETNDR